MAVALFVLSYVLWRFPRLSEAAYDLGVDVIVGGFVLAFASAALYAYANEGIVGCWLLVSLPVLGATLNRVGVGLTSATPLELYGLAVAIAVLAGVALGTAGFLFGTGLRRLVAGR